MKQSIRGLLFEKVMLFGHSSKWVAAQLDISYISWNGLPRMRTIAFLVLFSLVCSGCFQQIAINSLGGIMDGGFEVLNEEQDLSIAEKSIPSNLTLLETIIRKDPDNLHYLLLASIGYSSYALGFAEDDSIERAHLLYERGKAYGMNILNRHKEFSGAANKSTGELRTALSRLTKEDVPAVFWTTVGWGSSIRGNLGDPKALADLPKVEAMMQFVLEKDPTYYYGGADFFLGALSGTPALALGGESVASRKHFEECLRISKGKFLMAYVFYARSYAVQTQNRPLFESCLTNVDTTYLDILPEIRLSNAIAKRKAKLLRERIGDYFY